MTSQNIGLDNDIDSQLLLAAANGNIVQLQDWIFRLKSSSDAKERVTRAFLAAITDAPDTSLVVLIESGLVDIHAEDEINERTCLHEATISGRQLVLDIALDRHVDISRADIYGRIPLHYACMYGRVQMVRKLLALGRKTVDDMDHDNFTPLIHAIARRQLHAAEELLACGARIDPVTDSDHVPLNLACQYGSVKIVNLLLEQKAKLIPDAEGLFPQHLVARSGQSPETLLMLERYGADLDQRDKLYQWTPLFHAAAEGHVACIQTLLGRNVDAHALDEKGNPAMYYATWEGHLESMRLLGSIEASTTDTPRSLLPHTTIAALPSDAAPAPVDPDGIPDLSLPPPIIPLRRYGHNFLDDKTFIQLSFEASGPETILFYHDSKYPAARLTISAKSSDVIPRNIMLPIQEDSKIVSFQIDNLDSFAIDFDVFPNFGSKVIAKSVALPSNFTAIPHSSGQCCLPLFDPRLRAIGQISFKFQVIKPFPGIPLDITHFATYWRVTSQIDAHQVAFITGSSLSGDYIQIFVQLTHDGIPVLYPRWSFDHHGIDVPIGRMTLERYLSLGSPNGERQQILQSLQDKSLNDGTLIHQLLATSFLTLKDVLAYLPTSIHINIQVLFPTVVEESSLGLGSSCNVNKCADAILRDVFDHARHTKEQAPDFMRSIVFTSFNADICTALNWKQPNCKLQSPYPPSSIADDL